MSDAPGVPPVTAGEWQAALELVARFEETVDRRDARSFARFFTADGAMTGEMTAAHDQLEDVASGRDAGEPPLVHMTANHIVERTGDGSLQVRYLLVVLALEPAAPNVLRVNRITDVLRDTGDGWRIREHHVGSAAFNAVSDQAGPGSSGLSPVTD